MMLDPFRTPILVGQLGDDALCEEITRRLIEESARAPSVHRSIVGGWHGPPDIPGRPEACWKELTGGLVRAVREAATHRAREVERELPDPLGFHAHGWGTVLRAGHYSEPHDHRDSHWSTIWYADPGDPPTPDQPLSGRLVFLDPRGPIGQGGPVDLFPRSFAITPARGMLVVFPGWLAHFVHCYTGARPRVGVACNFVLTTRQ